MTQLAELATLVQPLRQALEGRIGAFLRETILDRAVELGLDRGEDRGLQLAEPDGAVVRVRDTGTGIAAADLPLIFERFYRADRSRGGTRPGSGIGLTVARELIGANGGSIEVEATAPGETTFCIRLPRSEP